MCCIQTAITETEGVLPVYSALSVLVILTGQFPDSTLFTTMPLTCEYPTNLV